MATTTALGSGSTNNNGGAVLGVGSSATTVDNVALGNSVLVDNPSVHDSGHADEAYAAGTFAYDTSRPTAMGLPVYLGGVESAVLESNASVPLLTEGVHTIETRTTTRAATAIRAGYWDISSGTWSTNPTTANDSFGTDYSTTTNKVTYLDGSPEPTTTTY